MTQDRYMITAIIGKEDGLGVENLHGSGMIAGETSAAYEETFTITLVSARSVGIGAYVVRLGQRTIQVEGSSIILTGAGALNKVRACAADGDSQQLTVLSGSKRVFLRALSG
jgi:acetyl-CoA carboxylase/biotin carboxylase 1